MDDLIRLGGPLELCWRKGEGDEGGRRDRRGGGGFTVF
jgi:hypothetical protein